MSYSPLAPTVVDANVFRSGQPPDWQSIASLGVRRILRLNATGPTDIDIVPAWNDIRCVAWPMPDYDSAKGPLDLSIVDHAVGLLAEPGPWLVHCYAGVDRTGIVVAQYRVAVNGWTREAAHAEWWALGSNKYPELEDAWARLATFHP